MITWSKIQKRISNQRTTFLVLGILLMALGISACGPSGKEGVEVGDVAPTFTLPSASGEEISLSDFRGSKPVLLYFHMADG